MSSIRACATGLLSSAATIALLACGTDSPRPAGDAERKAIADSLRILVVATYDLTGTNVVDRLMSLYPDTGAVYSTSSGHVSTTRAELQQQVQNFWQFVGSNMRDPKWEWTSMRTDVLAPDAAIMTATYRIPHLNPSGLPHVIGGAWTAAFVNRGGRWVVIQEHLSDVPALANPSADSRAPGP